MPPPDSDELDVATGSLRTEAGIWDDQSDRVGAIVRKAEAMRLSRLEAGIFQLIVSVHDSVIDQVSARCREGRLRMSEIAVTLRQVADMYEQEDRKNQHALHNLY